jgi:type VI secretion system secreted protein VgrG
MPVSQDERRVRVTTPLGDGVLILTSLDAWEQISGLFHFACTFVSEDESIDFDRVIGRGIGLEMEMAGGETRHFHGIVSRFSQSDADATNIGYRAELVPSLWLLTRSTDCRIFQKKSVTDIVKAVLDGHKLTNYKIDVEQTYPEIPYCVQYRETDFNFVSRLMEEWGISYYFEHSSDGHQLVVYDSPAKVKSCPGQSEASYAAHAENSGSAGQVAEWTAQQEFRAGAYAHRDFNYGDPSLDLTTQKTTTHAVGGNDRFELYDYPGDYSALSEGDRRAQLRIEAEECASKRIDGSSNCYGLCPGYKFALKDHFRSSFNDTYLVTSVQHRFSEGVGTGSAETVAYANSFTCVPHSVPFRPLPTTPRPTIHGAQTAIVVGESGKEIDVDHLGCVIVQFHWDRKGKKDASSSCRVRVSHGWAGKEWGAYFTPRIGQEVIVEFLEGDPNRPLVTGAVYNGEQKPPYSNPEHTGIKSRSTTKGQSSNFNEIRFEDTKDSELLFMQAEKDKAVNVKNDFNEKVKRDRIREVGNNETLDVKKDQSLTVGGNQTILVKETRKDTVKGDEIREVEGERQRTVKGNESVSITKDHTISVEGKRQVEVTHSQEFSVGEDYTVTVKGDYGEDVTKGYTLNAKTISLNADDEILLQTGTAMIKLESGGKITISGGDIEVTGTGNVAITGKNVAVN